MERQQMHLSIQALSNELTRKMGAISFTQADRDELMNIKKRISGLGDNDGVILDSEDESERQFLYRMAVRVANDQEAFYEKNGNKWAS